MLINSNIRNMKVKRIVERIKRSRFRGGGGWGVYSVVIDINFVILRDFLNDVYAVF